MASYCCYLKTHNLDMANYLLVNIGPSQAATQGEKDQNRKTGLTQGVS